ncbi:MAG: hypothetical protein PHX87_01785 [Candidatus Peribacteraceae bacterium]|nr:hypothetical protein [Candidatus Peribacteraceae bacterium]MDD5742139.1 hypothetical protein [Candidatus Peribacteraceae bacterium]
MNILLHARFSVGETVVHAQRGWQGVVQGLWAEGDGTIWVSVQRRLCLKDDSFYSFSAREGQLERES